MFPAMEVVSVLKYKKYFFSTIFSQLSKLFKNLEVQIGFNNSHIPRFVLFMSLFMSQLLVSGYSFERFQNGDNKRQIFRKISWFFLC